MRWEALCQLWLVIVMVTVMIVLSYELMAPVMCGKLFVSYGCYSYGSVEL